MAKAPKTKPAAAPEKQPAPAAARPSSVVDTRVVYCGDCLEQLKNLPDACVDLIYIDPPFNSNRNYEVFWGEQDQLGVGLADGEGTHSVNIGGFLPTSKVNGTRR